MNGEVGWSSLEIRFKKPKNPICIYLLWRSNDFNAMFVTVEDMETGHTKKYKYIGVSYKNESVIQRVLNHYGFTTEDLYASVAVFLTVYDNASGVTEGRIEIKDRKCRWIHRTFNGIETRSSLWRRVSIKGKSIYDMVCAVDRLFYKSEKAHILYE